MREHPNNMFRYAANYSLIGSLSFALVCYTLMSGHYSSPKTFETILVSTLVLNVTAIGSGLFSLFGLNAGRRGVILRTAIPGILIGLLVSYVLVTIGSFVG